MHLTSGFIFTFPISFLLVKSVYTSKLKHSYLNIVLSKTPNAGSKSKRKL